MIITVAIMAAQFRKCQQKMIITITKIIHYENYSDQPVVRIPIARRNEGYTKSTYKFDFQSRLPPLHPYPSQGDARNDHR